jgi:hypothetical protein
MESGAGVFVVIIIDAKVNRDFVFFPEILLDLRDGHFFFHPEFIEECPFFHGPSELLFWSEAIFVKIPGFPSE